MRPPLRPVVYLGSLVEPAVAVLDLPD